MTNEIDLNTFISEIKTLDDWEIQSKYLNCLQWRETIIAVLSRLEDETQALRIVALAIDIDRILGAILAGAVKKEFQQKTVALIGNLELCETLKIELLTRTKSQYAIAPLQAILSVAIDRHNNDFYDLQNISQLLRFFKQYPTEFNSDNFISLLREKHNIFTEEALEVLSESILYLKDTEPIEVLLKEKINSDYAEESAVAFECLVKLQDSWAIAEFKNDYSRQYYLDRYQILKIFSKAGEKSTFQYLIFGLFDRDSSCRWQAIKGLSTIDYLDRDLIIEVLLHGLCQSIEDKEERSILNSCLGEALEKIDPERLIQRLALMTQCDDINVRINALEVLRIFPDKSVLEIAKKSLDDLEDVVVVEALRNIFCYSQRNLERLDSLLSVDIFANCLRSNNSEVFRWTLDIINPKERYIFDSKSFPSVTGRESIYSILLERLQDNNLAICLSAIYNLGFFDRAEVKNKLRQLIESPELQIQAYAVNALGIIGDRSDIPLLIQKLQHPEAIVRANAAKGLKFTKSKLVTRTLIEALQDENLDVRESVISALGTIGGEKIENCLIALAQNTKDFITIDRSIAVLGTIGKEKTVKLLQKFLKQSKKATTKEECQGLPDPETVILALERIGSNSAIEVLLEILPFNSYPDSFVYNALANIGKLETIPDLWQIQLKSKHTHFLEAIASIQQRYQYYNPFYCELDL